MWTVWEWNTTRLAGGLAGDVGEGRKIAIGIDGTGGKPFPGRYDAHRTLWTAVILRALQDATRATRSDDGLRIKAEARGWFVAGGPDFHHVCRLAGFEPAWVRRQALKILD